MFKKGPTEKDKILRHITEKEIKEQLYSFNARPAPVVGQQAPNRGQASRGGQVKKEPVKKNLQKEKPGNPYLVMQIILLIAFLALIWVSLRQVIRVISSPKNAVTGASMRGQAERQVKQGEKKNGMERHRQKKIPAR